MSAPARYRVEVRGPWSDEDWRPAFPGPPGDPAPRDFDTETEADWAAAGALDAGGPFEFRVVPVDGGG